MEPTPLPHIPITWIVIFAATVEGEIMPEYGVIELGSLSICKIN
jgi:hypothetical protein